MSLEPMTFAHHRCYPENVNECMNDGNVLTSAVLLSDRHHKPIWETMSIIPRFCRFYSLEEDGTFPRVIYKMWDIGRTVFQCPPWLWKTWDIGAKSGGHWKTVLPMSHVFHKKWGTLKNSLLNVPRFLSWGTLGRKW